MSASSIPFQWFDSPCQLLKQSSDMAFDQWMEYSRDSTLIFSHFSFSIRDKEYQTLICDFPFQSINEIQVITPLYIKIDLKPSAGSATSSRCSVLEPSNIKYALKFPSDKKAVDFVVAIDKCGVKVVNHFPEHNENVGNASSAGNGQYSSKMLNNYPDVHDTIIQEQIVKLLFDEKFKKFVDNVARVLEAIEKEI